MIPSIYTKKNTQSDSNPTIYFVLPVYNEENGIAQQLQLLHDYTDKKKIVYRMIIVNDGCIDNTIQIIETVKLSMNVEVIHHAKNGGPGKAFKSAFDHIIPKLKNDDIVITMEGDNIQSLITLDLMINKIYEGYEVVVGGGLASGSMMIGVPFFRIFLTHASSWLYRLFFPINGIKDYNSFYRAVKGTVLKIASDKFGDQFIESHGFSCMAEMLIKYRQIPLYITAVPMILRYDMKTSKSKLRVFPTIKEHMNNIVRNWHRRKLILS